MDRQRTDLRLEMPIPFIASRNPGLGPLLGGEASSASVSAIRSATSIVAVGALRESVWVTCADADADRDGGAVADAWAGTGEERGIGTGGGGGGALLRP